MELLSDIDWSSECFSELACALAPLLTLLLDVDDGDSLSGASIVLACAADRELETTDLIVDTDGILALGVQLELATAAKASIATPEAEAEAAAGRTVDVAEPVIAVCDVNARNVM